MSNLVCLTTFETREQADMAKAMLESNGIKASVSADDAGGARPHLAFTSGGVQLFVLDKNLEKATAILQVEHREEASDRAFSRSETEITFECEECGKSISFPADRRGRVETCRFCNAYVDVPE